MKRDATVMGEILINRIILRLQRLTVTVEPAKGSRSTWTGRQTIMCAWLVSKRVAASSLNASFRVRTVSKIELFDFVLRVRAGTVFCLDFRIQSSSSCYDARLLASTGTCPILPQ